MKLFISDTYYQQFLKQIYDNNPWLSTKDYEVQLKFLISQFFGTSDFYTRNLRNIGIDAVDSIPNCEPLQKKWLSENKATQYFFTKILNNNTLINSFRKQKNLNDDFIRNITIHQMKKFQPDIFYCQDIGFFDKMWLKKIKENCQFLVGQIACPLPNDDRIGEYDLILTSFPHFVDRIKSLGIKCEYFPIGFGSEVLRSLGEVKRDIDVTFVGGISQSHKMALPLLETLAQNTPIHFYGYGKESLDSDSPILAHHGGEIWGLEMYRILARSKITINRHIDVAENNANNMRLFEATGVGTLLITDYKDNITDFFIPGKEIVTYSCVEEAIDKINYYLQNESERTKIATAGQRKTLTTHGYDKRMIQLKDILYRNFSDI